MVRQELDGTYYVDARDPQGKRKRLWGITSEKEAYRQEAAIKIGAVRTTPKAEYRSIENAINYYLENVSKGKDSYRHEELYFDRLGEFAINEQGLVFLTDIELMHLQALQTRLKRSLCPTTVNRHFSTYGDFFNKCLDWKWITASPMARLKALPYVIKKRKVWQDWQQQKIIDSLRDVYGDICFLFARTSIRPISICRLRWEDVNLEVPQIAALSKKGNRGTPRITEHPITPDVVNFLVAHRHKERLKGFGKDSDFVFTTHHGGQINVNWVCLAVSRKIAELRCEDPSFDGLVFYSFRHTLVTRVTNLVGIYEASRIAGHSSVAITEKFYARPTDKRLIEALNVSTADQRLSRVSNGDVDAQNHLKLVGSWTANLDKKRERD